MSTLYTTRAEAIEREIITPIEAGDVDDARAEFDIEAIASETIAFEDGYDAELDAQVLTRQGYRLSVDQEEFWEIVQKNSR